MFGSVEFVFCAQTRTLRSAWPLCFFLPPLDHWIHFWDFEQYLVIAIDSVPIGIAGHLFLLGSFAVVTLARIQVKSQWTNYKAPNLAFISILLIEINSLVWSPWPQFWLSSSGNLTQSFDHVIFLIVKIQNYTAFMVCLNFEVGLGLSLAVLEVLTLCICIVLHPACRFDRIPFRYQY